MLARLSGQELVDATSRTFDPERPVLVGLGPVEFSTSVELEPWPSIIWDTNLYYRDLGVHPKSSRTEIRQAYVDLDGEASTRLTMIARTLLNPRRRLKYDLVPLGSLFFDDQIEDKMRRDKAAEAGQARAAGEEVDSEELNRQIDEVRRKIEENPLPVFEDRYLWSYYLWRSQHNDTDLLDRWRSGIVRSLSEMTGANLEKPIRIGLGFKGQSEDPFEFVKVGLRMVLLVDDQLRFSECEAQRGATLIVNQTTQ